MTFPCLVCLFAALSVVSTDGQSGLVGQAGQRGAGADNREISGALATLPPATPVLIFGTPVAYDTGSNNPGPMAVGDVNGDGKLDVVLGNCCGGSTVGVLLGNGDGTVLAPTGYNVGGTEATSIAIGDVNGDGHPDLVVATYYEDGNANSGGVAVLLGKGDGTFQSPVSYRSGGPVTITKMRGRDRPPQVFRPTVF